MRMLSKDVDEKKFKCYGHENKYSCFSICFFSLGMASCLFGILIFGTLSIAYLGNPVPGFIFALALAVLFFYLSILFQEPSKKDLRVHSDVEVKLCLDKQVEEQREKEDALVRDKIFKEETRESYLRDLEKYDAFLK